MAVRLQGEEFNANAVSTREEGRQACLPELAPYPSSSYQHCVLMEAPS
ncbi:hypothetical protein [Xylella taiwanensis]|nr:hypothetical protein [Xylella taiwanensis]MCD8461457.1 hypothetical protein [Xylella taiwanensis]MCD8466300.1 hypothetical protein [Xylella taiwanensis]UFN03938.1 hypothetical protein LPH41_08650 [Xylella taiwanensis]UFN18800.1 hypothetical protein LPH64_03305 [Xylella taiwanensis]UFN22260.1 hypothetical protein LPH48_09510 [Xylella taiwanensis]